MSRSSLSLHSHSNPYHSASPSPLLSPSPPPPQPTQTLLLSSASPSSSSSSSSSRTRFRNQRPLPIAAPHTPHVGALISLTLSAHSRTAAAATAAATTAVTSLYKAAAVAVVAAAAGAYSPIESTESARMRRRNSLSRYAPIDTDAPVAEAAPMSAAIPLNAERIRGADGSEAVTRSWRHRRPQSLTAPFSSNALTATAPTASANDELTGHITAAASPSNSDTTRTNSALSSSTASASPLSEPSAFDEENGFRRGAAQRGRSGRYSQRSRRRQYDRHATQTKSTSYPRHCALSSAPQRQPPRRRHVYAARNELRLANADVVATGDHGRQRYRKHTKNKKTQIKCFIANDCRRRERSARDHLSFGRCFLSSLRTTKLRTPPFW